MIRPENIAILQKGYQESDPFPYIIIDNFLEESYLKKILEEVTNLKPADAYYKMTHKPNILEYNKFAYRTNLGPVTETLFKHLVSDEFTKTIEALTSINDIVTNDLTLAGAGVHKIKKDGYLSIHTDFNTYKHPTHGKLDRRINLLIYLNPDWKEEYKGHLWLCNSKEPVKKILPILNRCVIFNTTGKSFHGHPERLCVPADDIFRQSIACYYYTKNTKDPLDFEGRPERTTATVFKHFGYDI